MKNILLFLVLSTCVSVCSAQHFEYRFKVETVDSHATAKPLIGEIRDRYNTAEERRFFPKFDDATDEFIVTGATLLLTEEELAAFFQEFSYQLAAFERKASTSEIKQEDE